MLSEVAASLAATLPAAMSEAVFARELIGSGTPPQNPGRESASHSSVARIVPAAARPQPAGLATPAPSPFSSSIARPPSLSPRVVAPTPEETRTIAGATGASVPAGALPGPGALSSHLGSLLGLGLECPYAPGVEIACDPTGRVHVLTRFDQGSDETAMGQLMIAAEWAHAHGLLLSAAAPRLVNGAGRLSGSEIPNAARIDPALAPAKHVFTSEPRKIRRLLETDVRVHLLTPVRVGASETWFCTALN